MSRRDQELAHTAGLLHDIGKFALADRVIERGARADARPTGTRSAATPSSAPTCCATSASTARSPRSCARTTSAMDGRGYPDGLAGDEIPEIARIVAVAEVYDTLTAHDTYRTPMTSFEALTELRRVAGSPARRRRTSRSSPKLLAGRGLDYRHADGADFDRELAMEERIANSIAPATGAEGAA